MNAREFWAFLVKLTIVPFGCFPFCQESETKQSKASGIIKRKWNNIVPNRIQTTHLRFDRNLITTWKSRTGNENVWKWNGKYRSNWTDRSKKTNSGGDHFDRKILMWTEISDNLGIMESSLCLDTNYDFREGDRFFSVLDKIWREKWENNWSCFLTRYFPLQFCYNR